MPLERLILIAQVALIPVLLVAGLLIFGAWRSRRRGMLAILLSIYVPAIVLVALFRFDLMDATSVARALPTSLLIWRISQQRPTRQDVPEVEALTSRVDAGELSPEQMRESLITAASLPTGLSPLLDSLLRAAGSPNARESRQAQGVVRWASEATGSRNGWDANAAFTLVKSLREGATHADASLVRIATGCLIDSLGRLSRSDRDSLDDDLLALIARDGIEAEVWRRWAKEVLSIHVEPIGFPISPATTTGGIRVLFRDVALQMRGDPNWTRRIVFASATTDFHPDALETGIQLPLSPSVDDPQVLSTRLTVEGYLSGSFLSTHYLQSPAERPPGFRQSRFNASMARITYDISVDTRQVPGSTEFIRTQIVPNVALP